MTEASTPTGGYVGRFAPSPTGPLHFGSLIAAVASYLDARHVGGVWRVRMEDVDATRCRPEFAREILATLQAFGLHWDGDVMVQSERSARYAEVGETLARQNLVYACTCSRREIADSALSGIDGPVYPGTCRAKQLPLAGNALRIRTDEVPIVFQDRVQGNMRQQLAQEVGDFILRRRDGLFAYQLAVVVDDADQGITDVVRGADLIDSTARQIHLQRCLGVPTPRYLHVPVAVNALGQKLSKQTLAPAISPAAVGQELRRALAFLGQRADYSDTVSTAELLALAAQNWMPENIPRVRSRPA